jgi:hypothetical protein
LCPRRVWKAWLYLGRLAAEKASMNLLATLMASVGVPIAFVRKSLAAILIGEAKNF